MSSGNCTVPVNAEMNRYWNDLAGQRWVQFQQQLDGQIRNIGRMAMDQADLRAGQAVLDIGCGCGDSSLELARRVAPGGRIYGVDLSQTMLNWALERAGYEPELAISFERKDAQNAKFEPAGFNHAFSRFGVMFFEDPVAAFGNIRSALAPGGQLTFICWRPVELNPWMAIPIDIACRFVTPLEPITPGTPGPFGLADGARTKKILTEAGYRDIVIEALDEAFYVSGPGTVEAAVAHCIGMGPVGRLVADVDSDVRNLVAAALADTFSSFHDGTGVRMASATWIVTARA
ncbi:MAG: hypothetical protein CMM54_07325 [Rhodospirillaceae bacterium]|nr:hypothetical protein [Rhodospirillaceae bacterium]